MIKDNGLNPRDPDYDDYGYSDFQSDYVPHFDELEEFIQENADSVLKVLYDNDAVAELEELWKERNEEAIEAAWEARNGE